VTTKPKGLGLAICKGILEAHGGNVLLTNVSGKGTTLTLTIPIKPETKEVTI
jgi:signal transduction histidine kinase